MDRVATTLGQWRRTHGVNPTEIPSGNHHTGVCASIQPSGLCFLCSPSRLVDAGPFQPNFPENTLLFPNGEAPLEVCVLSDRDAKAAVS